MNDTCPKCGAEPRRDAYPTNCPKPPNRWLCGTIEIMHGGDVMRTGECSDRQIAALESRVEKLEGMLRKFQYYEGACRCCYTSRGIECLPDCELAQLLKGA